VWWLLASSAARAAGLSWAVLSAAGALRSFPETFRCRSRRRLLVSTRRAVSSSTFQSPRRATTCIVSPGRRRTRRVRRFGASRPILAGWSTLLLPPREFERGCGEAPLNIDDACIDDLRSSGLCEEVMSSPNVEDWPSSTSDVAAR